MCKCGNPECKAFLFAGMKCRLEPENSTLKMHGLDKEKSDGLTAHYYELPEGATELYHLIIERDMNGQISEIFRACYRYGRVAHSAKLRDINKILAYATQEKERLLKYELSNNEE